MNNFTTEQKHSYCLYYQAYVDRPKSWLVVAFLKSLDHVSFDRTLDTQLSLFEFFVPHAMQENFLAAMDILQKNNLVTNVQQLPNRLQGGQEG